MSIDFAREDNKQWLREMIEADFDENPTRGDAPLYDIDQFDGLDARDVRGDYEVLDEVPQQSLDDPFEPFCQKRHSAMAAEDHRKASLHYAERANVEEDRASAAHAADEIDDEIEARAAEFSFRAAADAHFELFRTKASREVRELGVRIFSSDNPGDFRLWSPTEHRQHAYLLGQDLAVREEEFGDPQQAAEYKRLATLHRKWASAKVKAAKNSPVQTMDM